MALVIFGQKIYQLFLSSVFIHEFLLSFLLQSYNLRCLPITRIRFYPSKNAVTVSRPLLESNDSNPKRLFWRIGEHLLLIIVKQRFSTGIYPSYLQHFKTLLFAGDLNTLCLLIIISNTLAIGFVCMCLCIQWKDINRFLGLSGWSPTPSVPVERPNMFPARLLILTQFLLFCLQSWGEVFYAFLEALLDERRGLTRFRRWSWGGRGCGWPDEHESGRRILQESDKGKIFYWSIQTCSRIMLLLDRLSPCSNNLKTALFQTFLTWHPNTFCPYCLILT